MAQAPWIAMPTVYSPSPRLTTLAAALFALVLVVLGIVVLKPFIQPILWAVILANSTWPLFEHTRRLLAPRERLAAAISTMVLGVTALLVLGILPLHLASELQQVSGSMAAINLEAVGKRLSEIPYIGQFVSQLFNSFTDDLKWITELGRTHATTLLSFGAYLVREVIGSLAVFLAALAGCYLLFRHSDELLKQIGVAATKLGFLQYRNILSMLHRSIVGSSLSIFTTAIAQGVFLGLGCVLFGISTPVLFGSVAAVLSLVPVGPTLIYVPISLYLLLLTHEPWYHGFGFLAWGLGVVSTVDNFLRAYFISHTARVSGVLVFMGVIGGIVAFGMLGIFIGPAIVGLGQRMWFEFTTDDPTNTEACAR